MTKDEEYLQMLDEITQILNKYEFPIAMEISALEFIKFEIIDTLRK